MTALPSLFLSHGSPMTALDGGSAADFWCALGRAWDSTFGRPRAILAASAHGLGREPLLSSAPQHAAVHDFHGFPPALDALRYDAPGSAEVAAQAASLLRAAGWPARTVSDAGLDHGIWVPLRSVWPQADVPVVPLAWPVTASPDALLLLGRALAPLAGEGVLVLASGSLTHNLRLALRNGATGTPESAHTAEFRAWVAARSAEADWAALRGYRSRAPHAAEMHPTEEHWLPFLVAAGAGGDAPGVRLHGSVTHGHLAMDAYAFGAQAPRLEEALADASRDGRLGPAGRGVTHPRMHAG